MATENRGQLGLGRGELGIGAQPDGPARTDANARGTLEENLRPGAAIDVSIHALARAVLGVAKAGAGFVGAAAGPDFHRMNGDERRGVPAVTASERCRQLRQSDRFRFRAADQFEHRMRGNGAGNIAFENCGHRPAVLFDLSESHG